MNTHAVCQYSPVRPAGLGVLTYVPHHFLEILQRGWALEAQMSNLYNFVLFCLSSFPLSFLPLPQSCFLESRPKWTTCPHILIYCSSHSQCVDRNDTGSKHGKPDEWRVALLPGTNGCLPGGDNKDNTTTSGFGFTRVLVVRINFIPTICVS